jgi:NSS family neurotransmitter:Na+ symporter
VAGFAVFGVVGFMARNQGVPFEEAIKGGPQLAFVVYPKVISMLPNFNALFGVIFFLVLIIAGLTSGVSLIEAFTCAITDKFEWSRGLVVTGVCVAGFSGSLIFTSRAGLYILDIVDHFITNYGLVLGGLLECLIVGWLVKAKVLRQHIGKVGSRLPAIWDFLVRYLTPAILIYLLYLALMGDLKSNYGEYPTDQLVFFGVGWMLICLIVALGLTFSPWKLAKRRRRHRSDEDTILT